MADKIIIFSGKQYSGKDTAGKIMLDAMPDYRRCAMGDIIKLTYGKEKGLTYEEIAEATNASVGTVKSRIARARGKLQDGLKSYI